MEDLRREVAELRDRVHRLERENLELRQQAGYWKSRHRDALQRITELEQESNNSKVKNANSKPISSGDAPRPRREAIAPITWMIPKTTPRNLSGNGASNRRTPDPSDGITPTCRSARSSSNCLPSNVSVPVAASPFFPMATRKIRSKSRSRWVPTAG